MEDIIWVWVTVRSKGECGGLRGALAYEWYVQIRDNNERSERRSEKNEWPKNKTIICPSNPSRRGCNGDDERRVAANSAGSE